MKIEILTKRVDVDRQLAFDHIRMGQDFLRLMRTLVYSSPE